MGNTMKNRVMQGFSTGILLMMAVIFTGSGCNTLDQKSSGNGARRPVFKAKAEAPLPPAYYDFKDVLVPGDFVEDKKHSSAIETGSMTTGFMSFYGRVEQRSVVNFFSIKMPEHGWTPISVLKSPFSTLMIFNKDKRWCTINIMDKSFNTDLHIGISPEISTPQAGAAVEEGLQPVGTMEEDMQSGGVIEENIQPGGVTEE